jgi:hypothetical protein
MESTDPMATRNFGHRRRQSRARRVALASAIVTAGVTGGMAWAGASSGEDTAMIQACVRSGLSQGQVRIVDSHDQCHDNEYPISWNQEGEPGAVGPQGPPGPPGPAGSARAFAAIFPAGHEGGPSFHGASRGFASVTYEELVPGLSLYCLVPDADSGVSPLNSVMLVSLGNINGGGFRPGAGVAVTGACTDDGTPTGQIVGWHVVTWGESGAVDGTVRFTAMVP